MKLEQRHLLINSLETRSDDNGEMIVEGMAVRYGSESKDLGGFTEIVEAGSLAESLRSNDIAMLYNHSTDAILGRTSSKTLQLRDTAEGLYFQVAMPDTTVGRDVYTSIQRGDIKGCSFGFKVRQDDWKFEGRTTAKRFLKDIDLREISFTPFPAYNSTSISLRSYEEASEKNNKLLEIQEFLNREEV